MIKNPCLVEVGLRVMANSLLSASVKKSPAKAGLMFLLRGFASDR